MLIKPWNELQTPRHIFEQDSGETLIPEISLDYNASAEFAVLCPTTIKVINESITNKTQVGTIEIKYSFETQVPESDEYDEDEQLYNAIMEKSLTTKYENYSIPIYKITNKNVILITVPNITNQIVLNLLAKKLVGLDVKKWISLAPCMLNNNQSLNKFCYDINDKAFSDIPPIKPPHFITGISASLNSKLYLSRHKFVSLVLNAEGQPGFERIDNDSLFDAANVLRKFLYLKDDFLKSVGNVRTYDYSSSGMYI